MVLHAEVGAVGRGAEVGPGGVTGWSARSGTGIGAARFPGCGTRAFSEAHHLLWYRFGGRTTLENLTLVCSFHHRLVHEQGWRLRRTPEGERTWFRPDGRPHTPGSVLRLGAGGA
ncbi:MAG: hypothetical protein KatS3mg014_2337 [Actinomycetota bacterium]|nr:MAG: hypothetical protein KatS3mg014_2337 [Actinomycetota bacterium]